MSIYDLLGRHERLDGLHWHNEADNLKPFNGYFRSDMWQQVCSEARHQGFEIEVSNGTMHMSRGDSSASFMDSGDVINEVWQFLRGN
jgi:hypothetical protein